MLSVVRPSSLKTFLYFRHLLWNRWTEFNETGRPRTRQEARIQCPLSSLCFKGLIRKIRWPPLPLIGWDIFNFSSETTERNSTNLDRKQHLKLTLTNLGHTLLTRRDRAFILHMCIPCDKTFQMLLYILISWPWPWSLTYFWKTLTLAITFFPEEIGLSYCTLILYSLWKDLSHGAVIFDLVTLTLKFDLLLKNFNHGFYLVMVAARGASLSTDNSYWLLLWNLWTEFNESWQEARSQCPLPSLCFSGQSEEYDGRPGLWLAEKFSISPLKPLKGIQRNLTGSKISMSPTKLVFFGQIIISMCSIKEVLRCTILALWASCFVFIGKYKMQQAMLKSLIGTLVLHKIYTNLGCEKLKVDEDLL